MSGMTRDEIVAATGYDSERILRICRGAGISKPAACTAIGGGTR
jgi:hypothetical protein